MSKKGKTLMENKINTTGTNSYILSFHEQTIEYDLHSKVDGKFAMYDILKNGNSEYTSAQYKIPLSKVIIAGYNAKNNKDLNNIYNIYYSQYYAVTEIDSNLANHLLEQWGNSTLFANGIILIRDTKEDAIAIGEEITSPSNIIMLDTGARYLDINNNKNIQNMVQDAPI